MQKTEETASNAAMLEMMDKMSRELSLIREIKDDVDLLKKNIPLLVRAIEDHDFKKSLKDRESKIRADAKRVLGGG